MMRRSVSAGTSVMERPEPAEGAGERVQGAVEVVRRGRIAGWALDRERPGERLAITVHREGEVVGRTVADRPRADLERAGLGDGRCGFVVELATPVEPGLEFTIRVEASAAGGAGVELQRKGAEEAAADPTRLILQKIFTQIVDLRREVTASAGAGDTARLETVAADVTARLAAWETAQASLEQTLAELRARPRAGDGQGVALVLWLVGTIATLSLGLGLYSLFLQP